MMACIRFLIVIFKWHCMLSELSAVRTGTLYVYTNDNYHRVCFPTMGMVGRPNILLYFYILYVFFNTALITLVPFFCIFFLVFPTKGMGKNLWYGLDSGNTHTVCFGITSLSERQIESQESFSCINLFCCCCLDIRHIFSSPQLKATNGLPSVRRRHPSIPLWGQLANLDQILYEASLGWRKGCIKFWGRSDQNSSFHGSR